MSASQQHILVGDVILDMHNIMLFFFICIVFLIMVFVLSYNIITKKILKIYSDFFFKDLLFDSVNL